MRSKVKIFAQIRSSPKTLVDGEYTPGETLQLSKSSAYNSFFLSRDAIGKATHKQKCQKETKEQEKSKTKNSKNTILDTLPTR